MSKSLRALYQSAPAWLVGALLLFSTPASAVVVITSDGGGSITEFEQRYATFKASDELVIIDGDCASACTLVLNIMPRERVCVTPRAKLGFHNAYVRSGFGTFEFSQAGTDMVWKAYPPAVKKLLREKGWDGGELKGWLDGRLVYISSAEMQQLGYRLCTDADFDPWHVEPLPAPEGFFTRLWRWLVG